MSTPVAPTATELRAFHRGLALKRLAAAAVAILGLAVGSLVAEGDIGVQCSVVTAYDASGARVPILGHWC